MRLSVGVPRYLTAGAVAGVGWGGRGGVASELVGARSLVTSSLVPTICLSMKSWLRSRMALVSAMFG